MFKFLKEQNLDLELAKKMIPVLYEFPKMDFESVLESINFKRISKEKILSHIPFLKNKFNTIKKSDNEQNMINWIMGELREEAVGNISLTELYNHIKNA